MGETKRLNVMSTTQKSGLYIGYHLCTAKLESGEEVDLIATPSHLIVQALDRKRDVVISYEDLFKEVLEIV
jgi:hypothetical protein